MSLSRYGLLATLAVLLLAVRSATSAEVAAPPPGPADAAAARQTIVAYYTAWAAHDVARYRSLCTKDYLILDNGEMSNLEKDVAYLHAHPEEWRGRTDHFDFRKIIVRGDEAFAVYFLNSEIKHGHTIEHKRYLESAVLRRSGDGWQVFLLHSTKLAPKSDQSASGVTDAQLCAALASAFPLNPPDGFSQDDPRPQGDRE